eukprot:gene2889-3476_t
MPPMISSSNSSCNGGTTTCNAKQAGGIACAPGYTGQLSFANSTCTEDLGQWGFSGTCVAGCRIADAPLDLPTYANDTSVSEDCTDITNGHSCPLSCMEGYSPSPASSNYTCRQGKLEPSTPEHMSCLPAACESLPLLPLFADPQAMKACLRTPHGGMAPSM